MSASDNRVFAAGDGGTILSYDFSSTGWIIQDSPTTVDLYALYGVTSTSVLAGGAWNHLLEYSR
jgi:hypothetical protein